MDLIASGEVTGKIFETVMVHHPQGLKAKRLLLVGGGKAKNFSGYELRKLAGTAARFLKPKSIRSFAFVAPESWSGQAAKSAHSTHVALRGGPGDAIKAIVEGVFVGNFDPDIYKSDRKDQSLTSFVVVTSDQQNERELRQALQQGRIVGESQNFTRELVNEPGNRRPPTMLAQQLAKWWRMSLPNRTACALKPTALTRLKR